MFVNNRLVQRHAESVQPVQFCAFRAKHKHGHIVRLGGWPIIWKSQLQSHISQRTLKAEYTALSNALRTFLPARGREL